MGIYVSRSADVTHPRGDAPHFPINSVYRRRTGGDPLVRIGVLGALPVPAVDPQRSTALFRRWSR